MWKEMKETISLLEECAKDDDGSPLVCHGCAHSNGMGMFPNGPSGERPCCFCIRNTKREEWLAQGRAANLDYMSEENYGKTWTAFYDNSPMKKCPMDCYISTDRVMNDVPEGSFVFG